jgi:hypothetical protein
MEVENPDEGEEGDAYGDDFDGEEDLGVNLLVFNISKTTSKQDLEHYFTQFG